MTVGRRSKLGRHTGDMVIYVSRHACNKRLAPYG